MHSPVRKFQSWTPQACAAEPIGATRVLLIAPYAPCGGGMGRIMTYLAEFGPQAGVIFEMVESRGAGSAAASIPRMLRAAVRIIQVYRSRNNALVQLNFGEGGSVARKGLLLLLADMLGLPTILHLHAAEIIDFHASLPRVARALMAAVFRRARVCIVLGPLWQAWLIERLGVSPSRVVIIHNGVPQPQVVHCPPRDEVFTLVFLGNLLDRKGLPDLLRALALLSSEAHAQLPCWHLLVAGGGDSCGLQVLARDLGIAQAVEFLGWLNRTAATEVLLHANALVLPSHHEALPLVLLEAASLGVPSVSTRVGAVPDIFTDGHDVLMVPPGDPAMLAETLARIMLDQGLAARIGHNARCLYHREFTMTAFVSRMAAVYRQFSGPGP